VNRIVSRGAQALTLAAVVGMVAACGLPRTGPNKREIFAGSVLEQGDAFVVTVNSLGRAQLWFWGELPECRRGRV
jgi:polysaccharide biosynthesis/export protein